MWKRAGESESERKTHIEPFDNIWSGAFFSGFHIYTSSGWNFMILLLLSTHVVVFRMFFFSCVRFNPVKIRCGKPLYGVCKFDYESSVNFMPFPYLFFVTFFYCCCLPAQCSCSASNLQSLAFLCCLQVCARLFVQPTFRQATNVISVRLLVRFVRSFIECQKFSS